MISDSTALRRREKLTVQGIASGITATTVRFKAVYAQSIATTKQQSVPGT
jgi:hypothetical protein